MKDKLEYEPPRLMELDVSLLQGRGGEYGDVSNAKFESAYDEEDAEHDVMEF